MRSGALSILVAAVSTLPAACSLRPPRAALPRPPRPRLRPCPRHRRGRHGQVGRPRRRLLAYANGGWVKATPIPADRHLRRGQHPGRPDRHSTVDSSRTPQAGPDAAPSPKIGDFYASYMDEAAIEAKGLTPLKPTLARSPRSRTARRWPAPRRDPARRRRRPERHRLPHRQPVRPVGRAGLNDPSNYTPYLLQGGLGLPDREYYLSTTRRWDDRASTGPHRRDAGPGGLADAEPARRRIGARDQDRQAHATRDSRRRQERQHHLDPEALAAKAPGLDWTTLLRRRRPEPQPAFIVWHPTAVTGLGALAAKEPLDAWKE